MGFGSLKTRILKKNPAYKGQESKDKAMGDDSTPTYNFAVMKAEQKMYDIATWGLYTAGDVIKPIYKAKSISNFAFLIEVRDMNDILVGKVSRVKGELYSAEVAAGADPIAVVT